MRKYLPALLLLAAATSGAGEDDLQARIDGASRKALDWLLAQQAGDGSWSPHLKGDIGVTAMALMTVRGGEPAERASAFLLKHAHADGSIFNPEGLGDYNYRNYRTSAALQALHFHDAKRFTEAVAGAQGYVFGLQGADGGVAWGRYEGRNDLANLRISVEAMKATGFGEKRFFERALGFLSRCQNLRATNPLAGKEEGKVRVGDDGSFLYSPPVDTLLAKAGMEKKEGEISVLKGYGGATCSGLYTLLMLGVPKEDARAKAAHAWLEARFTLAENPGMESRQGIYYYYLSLAKALRAWEEPELGGHDWAPELAEALLKQQGEDGAWRNTDSKVWMEGDECLTTCYALQALAICRERTEP